MNAFFLLQKMPVRGLERGGVTVRKLILISQVMTVKYLVLPQKDSAENTHDPLPLSLS